MSDEAERLVPKGKLPVQAAVNHLKQTSVAEDYGW